MHIKIPSSELEKLLRAESIRINPKRYYVLADLKGHAVYLIPRVSTRHTHVYQIEVRNGDEYEKIVEELEKRGFAVIYGEAYPMPA